MSMFRRAQTERTTITEYMPERDRGPRKGSVYVDQHTAMRSSAVWACLRLRADMIATMPIDAFRRIPGEGVDVEVTKPGVLVEPDSHGDGQPMSIVEWMYSTQLDLDRYGNAFGIITARDGQSLPARIHLVSAGDVSVIVKSGQIVNYRICGVLYEPRDVWHERQFTVAGLHVGLSPIAHAAWSLGTYLSAQQFATDWFTGGAVPSAHLKNTAKTLKAGEARTIKDRFLASVSDGDPFVTGNDWEYNMLSAPTAQASFLETMAAGIPDICRFLGVPGDMIDAPVAGGAITYANVTQRNLQLLVINLNPSVIRRETALSYVLSRPRFVKLNTDALLRMDPQTRTAVLGLQIDKRMLAPSEARALLNRAPFTPEQLDEFAVLWPKGSAAPTPALPIGG